jgi:pimeloyl-ACP methyl ester carboxylesterase
MPYLEMRDGRVFYAHRTPDFPDGPPLVFIHGVGGTHQHWLYQVRDLEDRETFACDLPGHGRSEGGARATIPGYADWLVSFLDMVELDRAVLVGHSMGGAIALDVALCFPARVAGLGLIGTGARLRVAPTLLAMADGDPEGAVRQILEWAFGPEASPEMRCLGRRQMSQVSAKVLHQDLKACDAFDRMERLREIKAPSVVICGTQDRLTPQKYSVYLWDHLPQASLTIVEGAGHMVMIEKPAAVAQALGALIEKLHA